MKNGHDGPLSFDLVLVKTSTQKSIRIEKKVKRKKELNNEMEQKERRTNNRPTYTFLLPIVSFLPSLV